MQHEERFVHYLLGSSAAGTPESAEIPTLYGSEAAARADLGVVMALSRLVHGDTVADTTSWYLQTFTMSQIPLQDLGDFFFGYLVDAVFYPVAGCWTDVAQATTWLPFVVELERQRASQAAWPWSRSMLKLKHIDGPNDVDFSCFRFAPYADELVVRPLHINVTEPLF